MGHEFDVIVLSVELPILLVEYFGIISFRLLFRALPVISFVIISFRLWLDDRNSRVPSCKELVIRNIIVSGRNRPIPVLQVLYLCGCCPCWIMESPESQVNLSRGAGCTATSIKLMSRLRILNFSQTSRLLILLQARKISFWNRTFLFYCNLWRFC